MKILNISHLPIWFWGKNKGFPTIYFSQKEFAKSGHEVYFLCPWKEGEEKYSLVEGIHIYRFDFPFNFRRNIFFKTNTVSGRIKATLHYNFNWLFFIIFGFMNSFGLGKKLKPDIVCAHSGNAVFPGYLTSRLLSVKFIVRLYGVNQLYWRSSNIWYRIKDFRDYLIFKVPADHFVIVDDGNYGNILAGKLGVREEKISFWKEGMEPEMYIPEPSAKSEICGKLGIPLHYKIIASTSRLVNDYGVDTLMIYLEKLFRENKNSVCLFAGDGPYKERMQEFAEKNNISERIFFLGIVERKMIKTILNAADIFTLLSRFHNCTCTMWEAMVCGKCIVTTETDPIKEILTNRESAILIPRKDIQDTPGILNELLNNDELRNILGKNAKLKAQQILEPWAKRMEKEIRLFEKIAAK